mmetsp:Transcript_53337/g.85189  ORF Transcript_53337/g.85189 Transcript_53337/m.85189 type:complete len:219 (-) Transcript_53337:454-1110(-)
MKNTPCCSAYTCTSSLRIVLCVSCKSCLFPINTTFSYPLAFSSKYSIQYCALSKLNLSVRSYTTNTQNAPVIYSGGMYSSTFWPGVSQISYWTLTALCSSKSGALSSSSTRFSGLITMVGCSGAFTVGNVISLNSLPNNAFFNDVLPVLACPIIVIFCPDTVKVVLSAVSRGSLSMERRTGADGGGGVFLMSTNRLFLRSSGGGGGGGVGVLLPEAGG